MIWRLNAGRIGRLPDRLVNRLAYRLIWWYRLRLARRRPRPGEWQQDQRDNKPASSSGSREDQYGKLLLASL
ncbi:hypothetical protein [Desulfatitalea tepidiphila]|uniref:hypothetical protein n=1 Tax=Desulfatitalea tepidiphila TaxID=1185843 RepID=UPI00128F1570|nr:hypothetical protein [Desulfatitalea tepidiphila]